MFAVDPSFAPVLVRGRWNLANAATVPTRGRGQSRGIIAVMRRNDMQAPHIGSTKCQIDHSSIAVNAKYLGGSHWDIEAGGPIDFWIFGNATPEEPEQPRQLQRCFA